MVTNIFSCKAAAVVLAASLFAASFCPPFAIAEELAPGFEACMKQAKAEAGGQDDGYEKSRPALKCYEAAGKYWTTIFETEYRKIIPDDNAYDADKATALEYGMAEFRSEWDDYLNAGCELVSNGDKSRQNPVSARFRAEETKVMVTRFQEYGIFKKKGAASQNLPSAARTQEEELAPGFAACIKEAKAKAGKGSDDAGYERTMPALKCYEAAYSYWTDILSTEYKRIVPNEHVYTDLLGTDKLVKDEGYFLYMFYANWQRYQEAVCNLVAADGGGYGKDPLYMRYTTEETRRVVQVLQEYGIFKKTAANMQEKNSQ